MLPSILFLLLVVGALASDSSPHFPPPWGEPPREQTMDYGPLPGGYGMGSSKLADWIEGHMEEDRKSGEVHYPPDFGPPPSRQTKDSVDLPFGYGQGSSTIAEWLRECDERLNGAKEGQRSAQRAVQDESPESCSQERNFPESWGAPPKKQSKDCVPLSGGYGVGPSTLNKFIEDNMQKDLADHDVHFPPDFGEPPREATNDLRDLPFGYGKGSGTIARWLIERAAEVYGVETEPTVV